jgi:hypothetical protein
MRRRDSPTEIEVIKALGLPQTQPYPDARYQKPTFGAFFLPENLKKPN